MNTLIYEDKTQKKEKWIHKKQYEAIGFETKDFTASYSKVNIFIVTYLHLRSEVRSSLNKQTNKQTNKYTL